tara:strand:- start:928 stop:1959 length:1032 start_codon:yes stop_codon:yes gene_type:complete
MNNLLKNLIKQFMPFAQKQIGFKDPPRLFLRTDPENAKNPFGRTAFYDPDKKSVTLYITGRHPKDILRSLGHELVHHKQNCDGKFDSDEYTGPGYAQKNPHLRKMEQEANRDGSMCLRDFEDMLKQENTIYYEHLQKGDKKMSLKDWKEKEIGTLLSEAWGFKFNSLQEFEEFNGSGEIQAEGEEEELEEGEINEILPALAAVSRADDVVDAVKNALPGGDDEEEEEKELEEGEIPDGLKKYMAKKKGEESADEETDEEEDKKSSGDSKKMPMQDEPEGKDLNKDGKKGHGKVPAFLKEDDLEEAKPSREPELEPKAKPVSKETPPKDLQEAIANLLRKHLRG